MAFNTQQFMQERFEPITRSVPVPSLGKWFDEGDDPVWKIRNLTGYELARANEIASKSQTRKDILEAVISGHSGEVKRLILEQTGHSEKVPLDMAKRIEYVQLASIEPVCDLDLALRLFKERPMAFLEITNAISELTVMGSEPGKSKPSGKTSQSKQP